MWHVRAEVIKVLLVGFQGERLNTLPLGGHVEDLAPTDPGRFPDLLSASHQHIERFSGTGLVSRCLEEPLP